MPLSISATRRPLTSNTASSTRSSRGRPKEKWAVLAGLGATLKLMVRGMNPSAARAEVSTTSASVRG